MGRGSRCGSALVVSVAVVELLFFKKYSRWVAAVVAVALVVSVALVELFLKNYSRWVAAVVSVALVVSVAVVELMFSKTNLVVGSRQSLR